jgi:hypothetical protein
MDAPLDKFDEAQQPQTITIDVTPQEINVIFAALAELPHRVADPLMRKLFEQAQKVAG